MSPHSVRKARNQLKMSQCELALKSGVSRFKLCMYEKGYYRLRKPDLDAVESILKILKEAR